MGICRPVSVVATTPLDPTVTDTTVPDDDPSADVIVLPIAASAWLICDVVISESSLVLVCTPCSTLENDASSATNCVGSAGFVGS